jgi:hypothetical protein
MDRWRCLPTNFYNSLKKINFFEQPDDFLGRMPGLNELPESDFRERFTAAFLRYLHSSSLEPEKAIIGFGRSWRQFQRYLVGGDQTPKTSVVAALAHASRVPLEWIVGSGSPLAIENGQLLIELEALDVHASDDAHRVHLEFRGTRLFFPRIVLKASGLKPEIAKLVIVHSSDTESGLHEGEMMLLDTSDEGKTSPTPDLPYLFKHADRIYLQRLKRDPSGSYRLDPLGLELPDLKLVEVIGRVVWRGSTL